MSAVQRNRIRCAAVLYRTRKNNRKKRRRRADFIVSTSPSLSLSRSALISTMGGVFGRITVATPPFEALRKTEAYEIRKYSSSRSLRLCCCVFAVCLSSFFRLVGRSLISGCTRTRRYACTPHPTIDPALARRPAWPKGRWSLFDSHLCLAPFAYTQTLRCCSAACRGAAGGRPGQVRRCALGRLCWCHV